MELNKTREFVQQVLENAGFSFSNVCWDTKIGNLCYDFLYKNISTEDEVIIRYNKTLYSCRISELNLHTFLSIIDQFQTAYLLDNPTPEESYDLEIIRLYTEFMNIPLHNYDSMLNKPSWLMDICPKNDNWCKYVAGVDPFREPGSSSFDHVYIYNSRTGEIS